MGKKLYLHKETMIEFDKAKKVYHQRNKGVLKQTDNQYLTHFLKFYQGDMYKSIF